MLPSLTTESPGSRFKIPYSLFQDPEFTVADRAFLEERGHTVIAYMGRTSDPNITFPPDPSVLDRISHQTFFFAPHLDIPVAANVMVTSKPSLYWGHDMFLDRACPYFVSCLTVHLLLLDHSLLLYTFAITPFPSIFFFCIASQHLSFPSHPIPP